MTIEIHKTGEDAGRAAAEKGAEVLRAALSSPPRGTELVRFVAATGASQFTMLDRLCELPSIHWERTEMFHLDEYVGLPADHPASFRRYLNERLITRVNPGKVNLIRGDAADAHDEAVRIGALIAGQPIDLAFVGIGENGHLAFNDPPADFEAEAPFLVIELDADCRRQQVGEGWFASIEEVPRYAISMSIRRIMSSHIIICTVPDRRKAEAVRDCLSDDAEESPLHPASILKKHPHAYVYLDADSASLLRLKQ